MSVLRLETSESGASVMNQTMELIRAVLLSKLGPVLPWMSSHYSCWRDTGRDFRITGETLVFYKSASILLQQGFLCALEATGD